MKKIGVYLLVSTFFLIGCASEASLIDKPAKLKNFREDRKTALFLLPNGWSGIEYSAATEILYYINFHKKKEMKEKPYNLGNVSLEDTYLIEGGASESVLQAHFKYTDETPIPKADLLVITSSFCYDDPECLSTMGEQIEFVKRKYHEASAVILIGSATILAAHAGLIDGIVVSGHPDDVMLMGEGYPTVILKEGVSFVMDDTGGKEVWSGPGGLQTAMVFIAFVEHHYGAEIAERISDSLVGGVEIIRRP